MKVLTLSAPSRNSFSGHTARKITTAIRHLPKSGPRKHVDLLHDEDDFECALLASLGFSTHMICDKTGLRPHQVTYRLGKGEIKRSDYRNGSSPVARAMLRQHTDIAEPVLRAQLQKTLRKHGDR
jgi:hypothetical protein